MTRITREQFLTDFKRDGNFVDINVKNLDSSTLEKLKKAGVSQTDLEKIAGTDGKINGEGEFKDLYSSVDRFEKSNPSPDYFDTKDSKKAPTVSGQVYDALKLEVDRNLNITRAQSVLNNSTAVSNTDPHMKHVEDVRKELAKEKLPTSAKGVTVLVMGDDPNHGAAVTRTIAGKAGLAQDADVRFQKSGEYQTAYTNNHRYTKALPASQADWTAKDYAKLGHVESEAMLHAAKEEISAARKNIPTKGQTRIGNMSWGKSTAGIAEARAMSAPTQSKAFQEAITSVEAKSRGVRFNPNSPNHVLRVRAELAKQISDEMQVLQGDKDNQKTFKTLKKGLEKEVKDARKEGLLIFNAAGNERKQAKVLGDETLSTIYSDSVKGLVTVGAADRSKATSAGADAMWEGSATGKGIEIAAPGVNLPVGSSNQQMTGTSFASPYAASIAALMVAANPKITPDEIESILISGRVTTDLKGDSDGKGMLDPVKAVKEARDLAVKSTKK